MKLLITREIPHAGIEILQKYPEIQIDYRMGPPLTAEQLIEAAKDKDAILSVIPDKITKDVLQSATKLKLVANYAVGYNNIDIETASKLEIYVSNTPGDLTESVAEFTIGLIFALSKQIVLSDKFVREGKYKYWDPLAFLSPKLMDKTLGIIGMGRIGTYTAQIAHDGLKMKILYNDPNRNEKAEKQFNAKKVELNELLENSDFVSLSCLLCDYTHHLIGADELKKMKPTAYLINTARGPIVNEAALYTALTQNWIAGAALDVFENEPQLYPGLTELENVILTPHIASATREARIQMAIMAANNIVDVLIAGKEPRDLVNRSAVGNKVCTLL